MNASERLVERMKLAGSTITIVDEEAGDATTYRFADTTMNRWNGGVHDACEMYGLSRWEASVIFLWGMEFKEKLKGMSARRKLPPVFERGVRKLIKRGWMVRTSRAIRLVSRPETDAIIAAGVAAVQFGESEGRA